MKKIFFSQRFHNKLNYQIYEERKAVQKYFKDHLGVDVEILDQYSLEPDGIDADIPVTWHWSQDLLLLGKADLVVFCKDWEEGLGCQVEMLTCKKYEIPYMIVPI